MLATWVGGVAGSFVAPSMDSLGISTEGSHPLLGGSAAIYVAFVLGGMLGSAAAAFVAYGAGRHGHERRATLLGGLAGIALAALAGYFSENVAEGWANAFFQLPFTAALVAGAIAGSFAGGAAAAVVRVYRPSGPPFSKERRFATLVGSLFGLWAGFGGGVLGAYLSFAKCPYNVSAGVFGTVVTPGCDFTQGSVAIGAWAGGAAGALSALLVAAVLLRWSRPPSPT